MTIKRYSNVTYSKWNELRAAINVLIDNGEYKKTCGHSWG